MKLLRSLIRIAATVFPVALVVVYGILVTSPAGEAARDYRLTVSPDPRVEIAALLGRISGPGGDGWPAVNRAVDNGSRFQEQSGHPAARRVRGWMRQGFTSEMLVRLLLARGPWPELYDLERPLDLSGPGAPERSAFDAAAAGITPGGVDSLVIEIQAFAAAIDFDSVWVAIDPSLEARATEIEKDPTLSSLVARLNDFLGEPAVQNPVIVPTFFGAWKNPFATTDPDGREIRVIDRASGAGRLTPETSLSWICVKEFARPTIERMTRQQAARTRELSGYWDYFRQGVAATSTAGWEDCLNAHLFRAIDLRVRPQDDAVERELRISSALQAGLGMIRVVDAAMTGFDRSRGFYRKFTDYYPTLLENLVGLEASVRVERPRLGLKVTPTGGGIRIDEILPGHSADDSPLKVGDVIVEADMRPVLTEEALAGITQSHSIGDTLKLVVEREGKRIPLELALSRGRIEYEFFRPVSPDLQIGPPGQSSG